ncbi:TRM5 [[Candida] subhashii]|uniref:tRNA (guanine(37)-N1)-methyltransferase n=1 Tax=[Candida] subhashii TaxID=561895 RepID=A0A8J5QWF5_9ASCO|nr:TRM5 [[Candida] subhashii]KAG7665992.1 TRM5 [[Candida] subhashii]
MSTSDPIFAPPINRSMKELDRSFFRKQVPFLAAYFPQPKYLTPFMKSCKSDLLQISHVKHIIPMDNSKAVLLHPQITSPEDISPETKQKIQEFGIEIRPYTMDLDYSFWKADDILRAVLPEDLVDETPTGFSQAGHIAHLNLRNAFKPFGKLIGQVILDKNPSVETVVDKADTIANKFRTFNMTLLAGKDDFVVEQTESKCRFKFDFSKVYWNSRLATEHERLVEKFDVGEVVGDVFAGVGPFAVPAGKKKVIVMANDLNPESYRYLKENIESNRVEKFTKAYNLDGREFIQQAPKLLYDFHKGTPVIEEDIIKRRKVTDPKTGQSKSIKEITIKKTKTPKYYSHFVMNLPDSALSFLNEFIGLYSRHPSIMEEIQSDPEFKLPMIHVHCFEKFGLDEEPTVDELSRRVYDKICGLIEYELDYDTIEFHTVRWVAPTKIMFCASFELPKEVAFKEL